MATPEFMEHFAAEEEKIKKQRGFPEIRMTIESRIIATDADIGALVLTANPNRPNVSQTVWVVDGEKGAEVIPTYDLDSDYENAKIIDLTTKEVRLKIFNSRTYTDRHSVLPINVQ